MKMQRMANSIRHIYDDLGTATAECKNNIWIRWVSMAACFALLVIAGFAIFPSLMGGDTPGDTNDRYKDYYIQVGDSAIIWPWEYQTVYEKYTELKIDSVLYFSKGVEVSASYVGDSIGS